jgi:predicted GTPase
MELLPIGPVLFIDTAGIDDEGALGEMRVGKTRAVFDRTDVAIAVAVADEWGTFEDGLVAEFSGRGIPVVIVFNKCDLSRPSDALLERLRQSDAAATRGPRPAAPTIAKPAVERGSKPTAQEVQCVQTVANRGEGILDLRDALIKAAPEDFINTPSIVGDLVPPGELVILVVPIDKEAPKGRLILPQVQTIRDLLDSDAYCMVVKERELRDALERLKRPPALVVTDSQAFLKVAGDTPSEIPMTSFSILFARFKGDLTEMVRGALAIETLRAGDHVLIVESCSHHPIGEDIGRVKIPRWLTQYVGGKLEFTQVQGHDFPADPRGFSLVVHCGACMTNRREVLSRIVRCREAGTPITNYGLTIAYSLGIFERALAPFPAAMEAYRVARTDHRKDSLNK